MEKIVQELNTLIHDNGWENLFNKAIEKVQSYKLYNFPELESWKDYTDYLVWLDNFVTWAPRQQENKRFVDKLLEFCAILDEEPVKSLQSPIKPGEHKQKLTPLSKWIRNFTKVWGAYLDTTDSAKYIETFKNDPLFNWDEYLPPPSGYPPEESHKAYRTFNQFFARHVKPGMRPIAGLCDDKVIVSPADSTFVGWWQINKRSNIYVEENKLDIKGIQWSIHQLMAESAYADRFNGGIFTHSYLATFDYHRWHSPVQGKILETRVIEEQIFLDVSVEQKTVGNKLVNALVALDDKTDYQFAQTRGIIVIDSPIGLVAYIPVGIAHVSSVVITANEGVTIHKGEELGYFQFGGSDLVLLFERSCNAQLICQPNIHYNQGTWIGNAYPYLMK